MITFKEKMLRGRRLDEKLAFIVNDYELGVPLQRLAAKHQISYSWIWQRLKKLGILRKGGNRSPHLKNRRFGSLLVIRKLEKRNKHGFSLWECRCDCGLIKQYTSANVRLLQSCGCRRTSPLNGGKKWEERCLISPTMWKVIERNALVRGLGFLITKKQAWDMFISQKGICTLTGRALSFEDLANLGTASLDRIDSRVGYTIGNIQWVHKDVNRMKGALSDEVFIKFCREVVAHNANRDI